MDGPNSSSTEEGGMIVVRNEKNELILTRTVTGWHVRIDYRGLNDATQKDHFPLPFIDQMLERNILALHAAIFDDLLKDTMEVFMDDFSDSIVLRHKISRVGMKVDKAKIEVIEKLPPPINVKGDSSFNFGNDYLMAFNLLKENLVQALILTLPDWNKPFELM
ncbi:uncharacterized protein LOC120258724 [Dioscorea cayenensis subsp. rotundata]|uniref:Uncharacterized protein LOC120258724 n=1 Tax=Dioscorea cayennensis subsp. rotundata TaxID=55577 RepID=A0AB40B5S9_DIOCR|nr:uncharacterized protein LOC120258724 [Dioscorea cayenensis subsp. rotundata]